MSAENRSEIQPTPEFKEVVKQLLKKVIEIKTQAMEIYNSKLKTNLKMDSFKSYLDDSLGMELSIDPDISFYLNTKPHKLVDQDIGLIEDEPVDNIALVGNNYRINPRSDYALVLNRQRSVDGYKIGEIDSIHYKLREDGICEKKEFRHKYDSPKYTVELKDSLVVNPSELEIVGGFLDMLEKRLAIFQENTTR